MKKAMLSLTLVVGIGSVGVVKAVEVTPPPKKAFDSLSVLEQAQKGDPESLYDIIINSQKEGVGEREKKNLELERDMIILQSEIVKAQQELDRLTGVYQEPEPVFDAQKLREELLMDLQAQMSMEEGDGVSNEVMSGEKGVDGIKTVKIEEIIQSPEGELVAEVTTVGQSVRLTKGQTIYGWEVKEIEFDSIIFEKNRLSKKIYMPI